MAASLATPETAIRTRTAHAEDRRARSPIVLGAPMLLVAVCLAGGATASCRFWFAPAHVLIGLVLLFIVTSVAAPRAPRVAPVGAGALTVLLGLFCSEVQPRLPTYTPLERIAFSTPTSTPAIRHTRSRPPMSSPEPWSGQPLSAASIPSLLTPTSCGTR